MYILESDLFRKKKKYLRLDIRVAWGNFSLSIRILKNLFQNNSDYYLYLYIKHL